MPRVARFRIAALAELLRQLQYAPAETRLRQMDAAERLVADIEPDRTYPEDFVVFRITGYRPEVTETAALVGAALRGDLVTFVQCVSDRVKVPADHEGREAIAIDEVARRLAVSTKTVQRYRRDGLVCHYVVFPDGEKRLACFADALARFTAAHASRLDRARRFSRLDADTERRILEEARRLRAEEGLSLNEAAMRLARAHGRAHETVRGLLRRHDRRVARPVFEEHGPLSSRDLRVIERAGRRGVSTQRLARRFGKTAATIRRGLARARAERLRDVPLAFVELPTFALDDAEAVILSAPPATGDLDRLLPCNDAGRLLAAVRAEGPLTEDFEHALVAAFNMLKRRAGRRRAALPAWPSAGAVDAIEADLRWASRLKRRLVSLGLPSAVRTIERNLHRGLLTQPAERVDDLLRLAVQRVAGIVEGLDPGRGQHLERLARQSVDRALAGLDVESIVTRASARHESGAIPLANLFEQLCPWDSVLDLAVPLRARVPGLDEISRELIVRYYGLGPAPPLTVDALAKRTGLSPRAVRRGLRAAEARLRRLPDPSNRT